MPRQPGWRAQRQRLRERSDLYLESTPGRAPTSGAINDQPGGLAEHREARPRHLCEQRRKAAAIRNTRIRIRCAAQSAIGVSRIVSGAGPIESAERHRRSRPALVGLAVAGRRYASSVHVPRTTARSPPQRSRTAAAAINWQLGFTIGSTRNARPDAATCTTCIAAGSTRCGSLFTPVPECDPTSGIDTSCR